MKGLTSFAIADNVRHSRTSEKVKVNSEEVWIIKLKKVTACAVIARNEAIQKKLFNEVATLMKTLIAFVNEVVRYTH